MDTLNLPTKRNLILARQRLRLAYKGYDLLDKKRQVLANELISIQEQSQELWENVSSALIKAENALNIAVKEMGYEAVQKVSSSIPKTAGADIFSRSIMGVELPLVNSEHIKSALPYSLSKTTISFDEAVLAWEKARDYIISWGATENAIYRLCLQIKRAQKRTNALGNIVIPTYESRIKNIQQQLEERERDELSRLKLIKGKAESQPRQG